MPQEQPHVGILRAIARGQIRLSRMTADEMRKLVVLLPDYRFGSRVGQRPARALRLDIKRALVSLPPAQKTTRAKRPPRPVRPTLAAKAAKAALA